MRILAVILLLMLSYTGAWGSAREVQAISRSGIIPGTRIEEDKSEPEDTPYILMGTFVSSNFKEAKLFVKQTRSFVKVKEGDTVDDYTVESIGKGKVVLVRSGHRLTLTTFSKEAQSARRYVKAQTVQVPSSRAPGTHTSGGVKPKVAGKRPRSVAPFPFLKPSSSASRERGPENRKVINFIELIKKAIRERARKGVEKNVKGRVKTLPHHTGK